MKTVALLVCGWNNSGKGFISEDNIASVDKELKVTVVSSGDSYDKTYLVDLYKSLRSVHDEVKVIHCIRDPRIAWGCSLDRFLYSSAIKNVISYLNHITTLRRSLDILAKEDVPVYTARFEDMLFEKKGLSEFLGDGIQVKEQALRGLPFSKYFSQLDLERGNPTLFAMFYSVEEFDAFQEGRHLFAPYGYVDSFCDIIADIIGFMNPVIYMRGITRIGVGVGQMLKSFDDVKPFNVRVMRIRKERVFNKLFTEENR